MRSATRFLVNNDLAFSSLQWRRNERNVVPNHRHLDCLLNRLSRRRSKNTSMIRVTGLCEWNSPVTGEFPSQRASDAEHWCVHLMTSSWWTFVFTPAVTRIHGEWPGDRVPPRSQLNHGFLLWSDGRNSKSLDRNQFLHNHRNHWPLLTLPWDICQTTESRGWYWYVFGETYLCLMKIIKGRFYIWLDVLSQHIAESPSRDIECEILLLLWNLGQSVGQQSCQDACEI